MPVDLQLHIPNLEALCLSLDSSLFRSGFLEFCSGTVFIPLCLHLAVAMNVMNGSMVNVLVLPSKKLKTSNNTIAHHV